MENKNLSMAQDYLRQAIKRQSDAKNFLDHYDYDKSIRESQESIEISIKAIFYAFDEVPPKDHKFTEENFEKLINKIPAELHVRTQDFVKPYLYSQFWGTFYTTAKYGLEKLRVGPGFLFGADEANLALRHVSFCVGTASVAVGVYGPKIHKK